MVLLWQNLPLLHAFEGPSLLAAGVQHAAARMRPARHHLLHSWGMVLPSAVMRNCAESYRAIWRLARSDVWRGATSISARRWPFTLHTGTLVVPIYLDLDVRRCTNVAALSRKCCPGELCEKVERLCLQLQLSATHSWRS